MSYLLSNDILIIQGKVSVEKPELLKEWDYEKNAGLNPDDFTSSSGKNIWWKCPLGHSWIAKISNRVSNGSNCPRCAIRKAVAESKKLKLINPKLAEEWNYEKNNGINPTRFTAGSEVKVWWKCKFGHEWRAIIRSRSCGYGCPYCTGKYHTPGVNDLQNVNPKLAEEWDYDKNAPLLPGFVAPNDNRKVLWRCSLGHSWSATVAHRNGGCGCPYCTNRIVLEGFNDLATVNPELAKE